MERMGDRDFPAGAPGGDAAAAVVPASRAPARATSRWTAAGIHLGLSAAIATIVVLAMYRLWYPPPYFDLMGGAMLVVLIVGCDVVVGPLITLIIFKSGKKGLTFDLATIAFMQTMALTYGLYTMFEARPVFAVFAVDRFDVVSASDIDKDKLAQARVPEFASFPLTGPKMVGGRMPTDAKEQEDLLFGRLGGDVSTLPRFYVPYDAIAGEVARRAKPIDALLDKNKARRDKIDAVLHKTALPPTQLGYVPIAGHFADMAVVVDKASGRVIDIVDANPW